MPSSTSRATAISQNVSTGRCGRSTFIDPAAASGALKEPIPPTSFISPPTTIGTAPEEPLTTGEAWDPAIADARHRAQAGRRRSRRWLPSLTRRASIKLTVGAKPPRGIEDPEVPRLHITGRPGPSSPQPDHALPGTQPRYRYAGTDDGRWHRTQRLTQTALR